MQKSKLIFSAAAFATIVGLGTLYLVKQRQLEGHEKSQTISSIIAEGQQANYRLSFQLNQKPEGGQDLVPFKLDGKVIVYRGSAGELVTEWSDLSEYDVLGSPVPQKIVTAMVDEPFVTRPGANQDLEHFIGENFPGRYLGMQIGLLDKIFIPRPHFQEESQNRRERDEFGEFNVQYSYSRDSDGKSYTVERKWTQSLDNRVLVDASANSFRYTYSSGGLLQKVRGRLIYNYRNSRGGTDVYTQDLAMELESSEEISASRVSQSTRDIPKADLPRAELASKQALAQEDLNDTMPTIENIEEALVRVDNFTPDSPGSEQQEIFQTIKFGVLANPSEATQVYGKILSIKGEDDISEAKSSLLFGALTSTHLPEVADTFADMAESTCPNDVCRMQAITSLNIHNSPSVANAKSMLKIAHESTEENLVSAAYLATGSIASKTNSDSSELSQALLTDLGKASERKKITILQAMGNHGSSEYYPVLEKEAKSQDTLEKASAVYSLRNVPNENATQVLISSLDINGSDIVNVNALRALSQKSLAPPDQIKVAEALVSSADNDVQAAVTDLLLANYKANVEGASDAIAVFKDKAKSVELKNYLDEAVDEIKSDREKR